MKFLLTMAALVAAASAHAAERSGRASAELLVASATFPPARPVETAIRLKADPGWHTYWTNPGEGGMATTVTWKLPAGWSAGPLGWPVPVRFMTGELPGYGYLEEVLLPVTLTPPAGAAVDQPVSIEAKVEWLTCSDDACVPGEVVLKLELKPGEASATPQMAEVVRAITALPRAIDGLALDVRDAGDRLALTLKAPAGLDLSAVAVFPVTPRVVDPEAVVRFSRQDGEWTATTPKSEYLTGTAGELELVLAGGGLPHPARVAWAAKP